MIEIRDIPVSTYLALLLIGCVAKSPMVMESEVREAATFTFNVNASQMTVSDTKQQDVRTNFVAIIGRTSHRCHITKAVEPKLYGLIPPGSGSTVSDATCADNDSTPTSKICDALSKKTGRC